MLEVVVLGSGSKGNATLVRTGKGALLVDAGLSARQLERRLLSMGQDPAGIEAIVLTHEHTDHISGLRVFLERYGTPLFANGATLDATRRVLGAELAGAVEHPAGETIEAASCRITSFPVPHDAAEPVGFLIESEGLRLGYATDLGHVTRLVAERLQQCDLLVVEANHDRQMLMDGPYPWPTKQRVASRHGHLSNDHTATLLPEVAGERTRAVVLAHLSETNNDPLLALAAVEGALRHEGRQDLPVRLARQDRPAEPVVV